MAKKTKEANVTTTKKETKTHVDPVKTRNLVDLLNRLALVLAILAFSLQLAAVLTHSWKWQITSLPQIIRPYSQQVQSTAFPDSRLDQRYGLFSRDVKLFSHHDEQISVVASTRFPRVDKDDDEFHRCVAPTGSLRGALLTCSDRFQSPDNCYCRRYAHWNAVIVFEIFALIMLVLLVIAVVLFPTQFQALLKLIGVVLAFLAVLSILLGLILILSYLKRETRTIADIYPHTYHRFADKIGLIPDQQYPAIPRLARRQTQQTYRIYNLLPGQYPFNDTHYQEFSKETNLWIPKPYSNQNLQTQSEPRTNVQYATTQRTTTAETIRFNNYGPLMGYDQAMKHTEAGIGCSTVLSILAMIVALLTLLVLAFSWLKGKQITPTVQTVTTTTVKTEFVSIPHEPTVETVPLTHGTGNEHDSRNGTDDVIVSVNPAATTTHS